MKKHGFGTNFHSIYASNAELYDAFSRAEHFSPELKAKIKELIVPGVLLDVGCGTGHKTNLYSKSFEVAYGLDNSQPLLSYAQKKYPANKKLRFLWASAERIPLLDESVNTVLITWGSFPLTTSIREMKRVLKPGGVIIRIGVYEKDEFTSHFPNLDIRRIRRINATFKSEGFMVETAEVEINFHNTDEAKEIMSKIIKAKKGDIKSAKFSHTVAFCYYKKS